MTSSLASCVSAVAHAPRYVEKAIRNSRPNKDGDGLVDTTKSSRRRVGKLRNRGKLCNMHDASVAARDLERTSRNAGPRPVHFPDTYTSASAGFDAPWISHRAEEVPVSPSTAVATSRTALHLNLVMDCIFMRNGSPLAQFNALSNCSSILLLSLWS